MYLLYFTDRFKEKEGIEISDYSFTYILSVISEVIG